MNTVACPLRGRFSGSGMVPKLNAVTHHQRGRFSGGVGSPKEVTCLRRGRFSGREWSPEFTQLPVDVGSGSQVGDRVQISMQLPVCAEGGSQGDEASS